MPNRINSPAAASDVKTGTIDLGTGADRYVRLATMYQAADFGGVQQYSSCNVGGIDLPLLHVVQSATPMHGEVYGGPIALSGVQTWTLVGTPTGSNWHTALDVYDDVGSVVDIDSTLEDSFTKTLDLSADVLAGDLVDFLAYASVSNTWLFDAPLTSYIDENPGSPAGRLAKGEDAITADAAGATFGGEFNVNTQKKFGILTVFRAPSVTDESQPSPAGIIGSLIGRVTGSVIGPVVS